MPSILPHLARTRVAYLTMEIGLRAEMHTYSGGLGILAGDVARSAADLALPMVFVTLVSREGYLRQTLDRRGAQVDAADPWDPALFATPLPTFVSVELEGRPVLVRPWLHEVASPTGTTVPVLLLDTDMPGNDRRDRAITGRLYGGGDAERLKQEAILGIGGHRVLRALGFDIRTYHLNEGHAALLPLALLLERPVMGGHDREAVRRLCVFTTHTPVEAGHDRFAYEDVARILGPLAPLDALKPLAGEDRLNMTHLALNLSRFVNGVARKHGEVARALYPGHRVTSITNGVHVGQWAHPAVARLLDRRLPGWRLDTELLLRADRLDPAELSAAHREAKERLIAEVEARTGHRLDPEKPILGFARRMTGYKRPGLLFTDLRRLQAIAVRLPFQVVMAGKAHPKDQDGKAGIKAVGRHARALGDALPVVFVPGYDMALAAHLVGGVDVWLNNPLPPLEASGTSGMKAGLNGIPNLSVLDGWWIEGWEEGVTGWAVDDPARSALARAPAGSPEATGEGFLPLDALAAGGPEAHARLLYDKLEEVVLPLWHGDQAGWSRLMASCIARVGPVFNSHAMMRRYAAEAYLA